MSASERGPLSKDVYHIGWVCALGHELAASRAMLDDEHDPIEDQDPHDNNIYRLGRIGVHNVVMACLPSGNYGTDSASTVAKDMLRTFTSIKLAFLVGIGGGVPSATNDIRLGDVVVSTPSGSYNGVITYDIGKVLPGDVFERRGGLSKPPEALLIATSHLRSSHEMQDPKLFKYMSDIGEKFPKMRQTYARLGNDQDTFYENDCEHGQGSKPCSRCKIAGKVEREARLDSEGVQNDRPVIHYGLIASGSKVIASAGERDRLRRDADILCFETEAAGLMDRFPCLVVRGISDYADSHKNDEWQRYAAAAAAAYAKELLGEVQKYRLASMPTASATMGELKVISEQMYS